MDIIRSCRNTLTIISTSMLLAIFSFSAQATVFDFTSIGFEIGPFNMSVDGIDLNVSGGSFSNGGTVTPGGVLIGANFLGVGIYNGGFDTPLIDGFGTNEVVILDFSQNVQLDSVTFGFLDINDQFTLFLDETNNGSLDVVSFTLDPLDDTFNFAAGYISDLMGIGARDWDDNFSIRAISVTAVPLPPAVFLFTAALIGLGWLSRRRKLS